ncbi:MAG: cytochrome c biogenesis CcdA family protein [Christensenellaceae bacterium]
MTQILQTLSDVIMQNIWLGPFIALLAGLLASFTPCCLSSYPLVISYVGANKNGKKSALIYSLLFCLGMTVTFTVIGGVLSVAGQFLNAMGNLWYVILGILMVFMALVMWDVIKLHNHDHCGIKQTTTKKGKIGAFLLGLLGGAFSSPCATPVLAAIVAIVASGVNLVMGIVMLVTYSIGHSILIVAVGTGIGAFNQISTSKKFKKAGGIIKALLGAAILMLGLYLLYLGF